METEKEIVPEKSPAENFDSSTVAAKNVSATNLETIDNDKNFKVDIMNEKIAQSPLFGNQQSQYPQTPNYQVGGQPVYVQVFKKKNRQLLHL